MQYSDHEKQHADPGDSAKVAQQTQEQHEETKKPLEQIQKLEGCEIPSPLIFTAKEKIKFEDLKRENVRLANLQDMLMQKSRVEEIKLKKLQKQTETQLEKLKVTNEKAQQVNQQLIAVVQKLSKHIKQLEGDQERRNAQMVIVFPNKKSMAANRKSVNNSPKLEKDDNL